MTEAGRVSTSESICTKSTSVDSWTDVSQQLGESTVPPRSVGFGGSDELTGLKARGLAAEIQFVALDSDKC